jgi:ubiquinone/menaquinone biosynthesis C-methylase UbiE
LNEDYYQYTKKLFKRWAPLYNITEILAYKIRPQVVNFINVKQGPKILDIATGTGKQAFAFAKKGYNVIGIDLSEDMLRVAKKKNKYANVEFKIADATTIPFDNNYFDVTCISFALHDMPILIRKKVLIEMVRVTKTTGIIAIIDYALPNNKILKHLIYHFIEFYESKYYPDFIKSDLNILQKESGIKIEKELSIMFGVGIIIKGKKL